MADDLIQAMEEFHRLAPPVPPDTYRMAQATWDTISGALHFSPEELMSPLSGARIVIDDFIPPGFVAVGRTKSSGFVLSEVLDLRAKPAPEVEP